MDKTVVVKVLVYGTIVIGSVVALVALINPGKLPPPRKYTDEERALTPSAESYATPAISPGRERPRNERADEVTIGDGEEVIGVVVDDVPRAYRLGAFTGITDHVVNDLIAGTPISVTYCDRADFVRVFTDDASAGPLGLGTGGWSGERMLLRFNDKNYEHDSTELPFQDKEFERTTWQEWKAKHPTTTVYVSVPSDSADAAKSDESEPSQAQDGSSPPAAEGTEGSSSSLTNGQ